MIPGNDFSSRESARTTVSIFTLLTISSGFCEMPLHPASSPESRQSDTMLLMDVIFLWLIYNENTKLPRLRRNVLNKITEMLKSAVEMQKGPAVLILREVAFRGKSMLCLMILIRVEKQVQEFSGKLL
jgi:hypothetical protein